MLSFRALILYVLVLLQFVGSAQTFSCPSPYVFMDGGPTIKFYDPAQPLSATNPSSTGIPTFGSGLTLMPNINGGTLTPTFYTTSGGNYWYWSGTAWVNTGHSTGNGAAVNLGGCNGAIYNLVGGSGQVYVYNGTSNGTLLTTLTGFNGGGPYDLQTDCNCNFYALNTTAPNQTLTLYSNTGAPLCTYSLNGMPNTTAGGGFAIVGNYIYVKNNISNPGGFYVGLINGSTISFTSVPGFTNSPGDFASCPVCYSSGTLTSAFIFGGVLGCTAPTTTLVATVVATGSVSYNWSGPGINSGNSTSLVTVSQAGTYSCTISAGGCPPSQITVTTAVFNNSVIVLTSISPSANICLPSGGNMVLSVNHTYTNDVISWNGPSFNSALNTETVSVSSPGIYSVTVVDPYTGCFGVSFVTVAITPTVALTSSDFSLCSQAIAGSPAVITLTAAGANAYTLTTSSNFITNNSIGPIFTGSVQASSGNLSSIATVTLRGQIGFCSDVTTASYAIVQNPTVNIGPASYSICPGGSQTIAISGANNYTWSGSPGLNQYLGSTVVATPSANASYSVFGSQNKCFSQTQTLAVVVMPNPTLNITPTNSTICLGSSLTIIASSNANFITWSPALGLSSAFSPVVTASPPYTQLYTVLADLNTCTTTGTVLIQVTNPPNVNLALSNSTICAYASNGSPTALTMTASGAVTYSLVSPGFVNVNPPNGPIFNLNSVGQQQTNLNNITLSLTAVSGVCTVSKTQTISIVPNPSISISPLTANICPGKTQAYTAVGAQNYFWQPGGSYTLTSPNSIVATSPGTSYHSVFGESAGCFSDTRSAVLLINPIPTVAIAQSVYTVCAGNSVLINANTNGTSYSWSPPVFLNVTYGSSVVASPATSQNYTVLSTLNSCTRQAVTTVSVINNPIISATAKEFTICSGTKTQLLANGALSYNWLPANSLEQASGNIVIANPKQNTSYTVQGFNGICTGSSTVDIVVLNYPDLHVDGIASQVCEGSRTTLFATGAQQYQWSPSNTLFMSPGDSVVVAAPSANTNYTIIGTNQLGSVTCQSQMSYSVIVIPYTKAVIAPETQICLGQKVNVWAKGGDTYSWSPSEGLSGTVGPTVVASPSVNTIYQVYVSNNGACGSSASVQVIVLPRPEVTASNDTTYKLNELMLIHAQGTGSLMWIQGEAIVCNDCPETRVYATHNGCYIVQAINESGCLAFDDVCLTIEDDFSVFIPNTFTPNRDGHNDVFLVYGEGISQVTMNIYDRWGVRVFHSDDVTIGWDGTLQGVNCKQDVYTYVVSYFGLDRKLYSKSGHVNLIR